jgi:hypothetical protein
LEVASEPVFLIVEEGLDRADVEDRQSLPRLREHLRDDGKEYRFRLPAGSRRKDYEVGSIEVGGYGQSLDGSQFPPAEGVDDMVLKCRM